MNKHYKNVIALAIGIAFSTGLMAQTVSEKEYKASKDRISADYKSIKAGCSSHSGNAKDICEIQASGTEKLALAELDARQTPSSASLHRVRVVKAETEYALAKERCDDRAGNAKDVCVKEAKAVETAALADAKLQMKTTDANAVAREKTADARVNANTKTGDARREAADDKSDAKYDVEKQKCGAFAGDAKDQCLAKAKSAFGK